MNLSHSVQPSLLTTSPLKHCGCCERCEKQARSCKQRIRGFRDGYSHTLRESGSSPRSGMLH